MEQTKRASHKPHIAVRILLQLLSFVLCISLLCAVLTATLVADLRQITSKDGIEQLVMAVIKGDEARKQTSAVQDMLLDEMVKAMIPEDSSLAEMAKEKLREMMEQSTAVDFITEKVAGFTSDFISGENTTKITVDEILEQVEQNKELVEQYLGRAVDEEFMDKVKAAAQEVDLDKLFRENFFGMFGGNSEERPRNAAPDMGVYKMSAVEYVIPNEPQSVDLQDVIATLRLAISDETFYCAIGLCAVIALMLLLGNYYSIPGGLGWISAAVIAAGGMLSAPVYFAQSNPEALATLLEDEAFAVEAVMGILASVAPIHYTVLCIGVGIAALSVVARIVRAVIRKMKYA